MNKREINEAQKVSHCQVNLSFPLNLTEPFARKIFHFLMSFQTKVQRKAHRFKKRKRKEKGMGNKSSMFMIRDNGV